MRSMSTAADSPHLTGIFNFQRLSDSIITSGQPDEGQLAAVARAGFEVVVNLALHDDLYSLRNERDTVEAWGCSTSTFRGLGAAHPG